MGVCHSSADDLLMEPLAKDPNRYQEWNLDSGAIKFDHYDGSTVVMINNEAIEILPNEVAKIAKAMNAINTIIND